MIKYLGHYTQQEALRDNPSKSSMDHGKSPLHEKLVHNYNILLEYSLLDLDEVFCTRLPPVFPREIEAFWEALFKVADAVDEMHNLKIKQEEYFGYVTVESP